MMPFCSGSLSARLFVAGLLFASVAAHAETAPRFVVSADGQEVLDTSTQLTWRRCAEGTTWNGKICKGKVARFTLATARKYVSDLGQKSPDHPWRIPGKEDLESLVIKGKKAPLIDLASFPNTKSTTFGALRPGFDDNLNCWVVNFRTGHVLGYTGQAKFALRLVRKAA